MKRFAILMAFFAVLAFAACGGEPAPSDAGAAPAETAAAPVADDGKGVGEIKEVSLNSPLNAQLVEKGKSIYEMKCAACHKLTDQRVVGPGFTGVTERRKPEWIMNMITNTEVMLAEDPAARKLLEECLVQMPNQNLSVEDARAVLEFLYANDGGEVAAN